MTLSQPSGTFRLRAIQCLRAFAASMVLFQHSVFYAGQAEGWELLSFRRLQIGALGVLLFFLISGFVMAMQVGQSPLRFAAHRVLRIYPGYGLALGLATLLIAA